MEFDFQKQPGKARKRYYAPDPKEALVSIITPFYNAGKYFEQTFYSVMNQTFPWFEWVIVNDGSTRKEDVELLHRLAAQDPRVRVVTQENGGLSCARNTGIANTRTDLVVPLDADDLIAPTYLECLYWSMKYHPEAAWSYTSTYGFHDQEYIWKYPFDAEKLKTYNFLNYTGMIRKADIQQIGGYKVEKWSYYEDWRFWLEMLAKDKIPVHIASCLFWYRRLDSGMLSTINQDKERVAFCQRIIKEAASKANGQVKAVEYPLKSSRDAFHMAEYSRWDRKSYDHHEHKRILWLIPWMMMGGADKFNLDAIAGLKEKGFEHCILTTVPTEHEWRQKFEEYTDEIFSLPDFLDPAYYLEFVSYYLQSREIDAIMLTNSYDGYYMIPWIRQYFPNIPIIDYVHMEEWYWRSGGYARTSGSLAAVTEKTYVCNSATRDVMISHFGRKPESVETLHIGVDETYFDREKTEAGLLYRELGIGEQQPIVLFICRLHPQKRPFLMIEIAKEVKKKIPDVVFAVVGDGPQKKELQLKTRSAGLEETVRFLGAKKDVRPYYRDAKITLVCSLKEGLSLTAYESCAMGVPVVSSDVGGQRDLVDNTTGVLLPCLQDEKNCLDSRTFPQEEIESYTNAIVRLLTDKSAWEECSVNCRRKVESGFTIQNMVERLAEAFEELTENAALAEKRRAISESLQNLDPMAAELYVTEMQWQWASAMGGVDGLRQKIQRAWKTEGFVGLLKKVISKIIWKYFK